MLLLWRWLQAGQYAAETYESAKDVTAQAGTKASQMASDAYDTAADAATHATKHAHGAASQVSRLKSRHWHRNVVGRRLEEEAGTASPSRVCKYRCGSLCHEVLACCPAFGEYLDPIISCFIWHPLSALATAELPGARLGLDGPIPYAVQYLPSGTHPHGTIIPLFE